MNDITEKILSKFQTFPCPDEISIDFKTNPNVYSAQSQLPDLYLKSKTPIDKNICFYNINYSLKLKENIFPKKIFELPNFVETSTVKKKVEKVDLDDLFGKVKLIPVDVFDQDFNLDDIEDSLVKRSIKKIIQEGKVVPYEVKPKKEQWYLIGIRGYGPYSDEEIFNFIQKIETDEKFNNLKGKFMIWERTQDIFYTFDVCFDLLKKRIEEKQKNNPNTKPLPTGKNDFENLLFSLQENELNGNILKREIDDNIRRKSKFNTEHLKKMTGNFHEFQRIKSRKNTVTSTQNVNNKNNYSNFHNNGHYDSHNFQRNNNKHATWSNRYRNSQPAVYGGHGKKQKQNEKKEKTENQEEKKEAKPAEEPKVAKLIDITDSVFA